MSGYFRCWTRRRPGRGGGLDAERSGLFFEIARLVGEIRPSFVFLENVSAITVRGSERVIAEFDRLRYDCRWGLLSASDVGANHQRERWWLLAKRRTNVDDTEGGELRYDRTNNWTPIKSFNTSTSAGSLRRKENVADTSIKRFQNGRGAPLGNTRKKKSESKRCGGLRRRLQNEISDASPEPFTRITARGSKRQESNPFRIDWWKSEPNVGRVAHGVPLRVDRLRGLGNAVVPAQAREAFERLLGLK
jgi:DNA (cytosine-5)-methyltransferase 1